MGLEYRRRSFTFPAPLVSLAGDLAPFFAVGRGGEVGCRCNFVLGRDRSVPEADKMVPGCGEDMGAGVVGRDGGERRGVEME